MLLLPNCKINIGLNIVGKRADGYHDLETFFYPIPLRDNLEFRALCEGDGPTRLSMGGLTVAGRDADNLVVKVYNALCEDFDLPSLDIYLYKKIPTGAGLGGGSSDAAFMLKGLNEAFDLELTEDEMERRISSFGADCAFFVRNTPAFATGIGDKLQPAPISLKGKFIVLVKPEEAVSTREAYAHVVPQKAVPPLSESIVQPIEKWRDTVINDFERSIFPHHPELAAIKQTLYDMGALYASMSGSGSTVYGIFGRPTPEAPTVFARHFVFCTRLCL